MNVEKSITYRSYENVVNKSQLGLVAEGIITCITNSFGHVMPEEEVTSAINGPLVTVAEIETRNIVGFSSIHEISSENLKNPELKSLTELQGKAFSFGAGTVDRSYQGRGIYRELNRIRLRFIIEHGGKFLETTTQNPRVERGVIAVFEEFISQGLIKGYELYRYKIPGFYGRRLTQYPIETKNTPFEDLDIEAGDCFELVFKIIH